MALKIALVKPQFSITTFRYLRNVSRRTTEPKLLKNAKVKTESLYSDEFSQISNYKEFVDKARESKNLNEFEIEEAFSNNEDFGVPYLKAHDLHKYQEKEEKLDKAFVKKKIIEKKYFKLDFETNLLTYGAKEQIRYLHNLNPTEWSHEILAENFPISIKGVKKLLKNNYELTTLEKIEKHDQEVYKRLDALKSGKPSQLISYTTQKLWDEGVIMRQNFEGNPLLPKPMKKTNKIVIDRTRETTGEFASIVKRYVDYKKKMESYQKVDTAENQVQVIKDTPNTHHKNEEHKQILKEFKKYRIDDEYNTMPNISPTSRRKQKQTDEDVPLKQFTENLKEEASFRKSKTEPKYVEWLNTKPEQDELENTTKVKPNFEKIVKHKKDVF